LRRRKPKNKKDVAKGRDTVLGIFENKVLATWDCSDENRVLAGEKNGGGDGDEKNIRGSRSGSRSTTGF